MDVAAIFFVLLTPGDSCKRSPLAWRGVETWRGLASVNEKADVSVLDGWFPPLPRPPLARGTAGRRAARCKAGNALRSRVGWAAYHIGAEASSRTGSRLEWRGSVPPQVSFNWVA